MTKNKILKLHEMESTRCALSCHGCYLKKDKTPGHGNVQDYYSKLDFDNLDLYNVIYVNNLNRDPYEIMKPSKLVNDLIDKGADLQARILVLDSVTAAELDPFKLASLFHEIVISPKDLESTKLATKNLKTFKGDLTLLFTPGVDDLKTIKAAYNNGLKKIEVNLFKPPTQEYLTAYHNTLQTLKKVPDLEVTSDGCFGYVMNGRNCHDPQDGTLELTTFLNTEEVYSCAYPINECHAKMKQEIQ